ncbi:MAG: Dihydropyrimidinase [Chloroflexi bacterium]|nr:Dihydropyrimidinase [Chloroflexota bacterium]
MAAAPVELAIRGGTIVTPDTFAPADIGIRDGRIVQIGGTIAAEREIDARGRYVLPGGIDMHVHLTPVEVADGTVKWMDDFASGSRAAAAGGITTLGNITFPRPGEGLQATIDNAAIDAARSSIVDFVLHPVLLDPSPERLAEIPLLAAQGHTSLKIFMILGEFDARAIEYLEAMSLAGQNGLLTLIHCEDACIISVLTQRLLAAGRGDLRHYPDSRPIYSESVAVARAAALCEAARAPIYIVHLSSREALREASRARARGLPVYVETRPLYLYFTAEKFEGPDAGLYIGNPPLRSADDVDALWAGLSTGTVQTCCTDHAPWSREQKVAPGLTIASAPPGVADLETLMPIMYSEGVRKGRLSLQHFVDVTSTNAAKLFGLFPQKGTIAVGSDADLAIWDPNLARTVKAAEGQSLADYSLYEDWTVTGWPVTTISRGDIIYDAGRITAQVGRGRLVRRGPTMQL